MPQTGISSEHSEPLATSVTTDGRYRYAYFVDDVVAIQKPDPSSADGWKTEYVFRDNVCPCTGHQYRGDCKHKAIALSLINWWRYVGSQTPPRQPTAPAEG